MLVFTPEVKQYLEWFVLTHQLRGGYGWLAWQRVALPIAGGMDEQPAKLMEALAFIAREENAQILLRTKKPSESAG